MPVTTGAAAKLLWPGLNDQFGQMYKEYPLECMDLVEVKTSDKAWEEVLGMRTMGLAPIKTQGGSISYDEWKQTWVKRYTHIVYGLGCIVTREMLEDDQYNIAKIISGKGGQAVQGLAFSLRQTKEVVVANHFNRGFDSTYKGGDGKEFFATDHPLDAGGTISNELATSADLSELSLEQMCIDIAGYVNDAGLKIAAKPVSLHVPKELVFDAHRILKSTLQNDSAENAINALRSMNMIPGGVKVNHYFTDTDAFFVKTDIPGAKMFVQRPAEFQIDGDFDTENSRFKSTERYSSGWDDFRCYHGSPGG